MTSSSANRSVAPHNVVTIEDTTLEHCLEVLGSLRTGDLDEALHMGLDPEQAVQEIYKRAIWKRTGLINNEPAAIWGVVGTPMGEVGIPYLITSEKVLLISSLKFAKIYIQELQEMKKLFPKLENYVDMKYTGACRLLEIAGFSFEPVLINNNDFYKFSMETQ